MKVLNLYCGLGGNRKLWKNVKVTAVEMDERIASIYKKLFPKDMVIVGDAHEYLITNFDRFDFIWSSPPCQSHSRMMKGTRHDVRKYPDMNLYEEVIWLRHFHKGNWVVENVRPYYTPLIEPDTILGRHCIWSNFNISDYTPPSMPNFIQAKRQHLKEYLGLQFNDSLFAGKNLRPEQLLRNCVHPNLGLHVFNESCKATNSALSKTRIISKAISIKQKQYEASH
jgi:DNA (cytosine-5)-methyltransferase 1